MAHDDVDITLLFRDVAPLMMVVGIVVSLKQYVFTRLYVLGPGIVHGPFVPIVVVVVLALAPTRIAFLSFDCSSNCVKEIGLSGTWDKGS